MTAYLPIIAQVIVIVNTVIAVYSSHFKPEERLIKIRLLMAAILMGVVACVATIWSQYNVLATQAEAVAARTAVRGKLAELIDESSTVLRQLQDQSVDQEAATSEANKWYGNATEFVKTLGPDYSARFDSMTGMSSIIPVGVPNKERSAIWVQVYYRGARLEQFASEFSR